MSRTRSSALVPTLRPLSVAVLVVVVLALAQAAAVSRPARTTAPGLGDFVLVDTGLPDDVEGVQLSGMTPDGRYVVLAWETAHLTGISVLDRGQDELLPVTVEPDGDWSSEPSEFDDITPDGRHVLFTSYGPLVAGDTNDHDDVFVRDLVSGTTARVSVTSRGAQVPGYKYGGGISDDGSVTSFMAYSGRFTPRDPHRGMVYVHDAVTGRTERVSTSRRGHPADRSCSITTDISADGRFVGFDSGAANLGGDRDHGKSDVFVKDRRTGRVHAPSVGRSDVYDHRASFASLSADGRRAGFDMGATTPHSIIWRPYVRDLATGRLFPLAVDTAGNNRDGEVAALVGGAARWALSTSRRDLTGEEGPRARSDVDTYLVRLATGETYRLTGPAVPVVPPASEQGTAHLWQSAITSDRTLFLVSTFDPLVAGDDDGFDDLYQRPLAW